MSRWLLQITAGTGPAEVREFVAALALALESHCEAHGLAILDRISDGDPPRSAGFTLAGDAATRLADQIGTHALVARSATRSKHARKRWYAGVALFPVSAQDRVAIAETDVEFTAARASGPGGQHVNVTESAVRATHLPSGLVVRVSSERSQHANRRTALIRLGELLAQREQDIAAAGGRQRWLAHHTLERGHAIAQWERDGEAPGIRRKS